MTAIGATNRGLADMPQAMLTTSPDLAKIDVEALERLSPDAVVLNVRESEEYARGHMPGAINVPQADLASRLNELPCDHPILAICRGGSRSLRAAQYLKQAGFDQVVSVKGGTEAWRAVGNRLAFGDTSGVEEPRIADSGWAHAGAS
jgi:rhodanese-related sulfurtransferase